MTIQLNRRTVALALAAFLALTAIATTSLVLTLSRTADAGGGFSDTPPWIAAHAEWLQDNDIADGFPDGTFKPNDNITRGQAAYWLGNYNDSLELVRSQFNNRTINGTVSYSATCPFGKRPVAGGGETSSSSLRMNKSSPITNSWGVRWVPPVGTSSVSGVTVEVWALCAPETLPG